MTQLMPVEQQRDWLQHQGFPLHIVGTNTPQHHKAAIITFQLAVGLVPDGIWGPKTQTAAFYVGLANGKVSKHFVLSEFACNCYRRGYRGRNAHGQYCNGWPSASRNLLMALDAYRDRYGLTTIVSGHRCWPYHAGVVYAGRRPTSLSSHLAKNLTSPTTGVDVHGKASVAEVSKLRVFRGLGYQGRTRLVTHVDVLPIHGPTGAPTVWEYS